jgi:hypothetical protein
LQYNYICTYILIYIIYGDRTIISFVDFVANLLNRPIDGDTVSVRKRVTFRPLVSTVTVFINGAYQYHCCILLHLTILLCATLAEVDVEKISVRICRGIGI